MIYIDPVQVSPKHYNVLLENPHVRVLEMKLRPGDKDEPHSHPAETVYFVKGGRARIAHLPEGQVAEVEIPDGGLLWHEPWTHQVENVGDSDIYAIIVEAKSDLAANEELAHRFHMEVFQDGNLAAADELLGPDFFLHAPGYPPEWQRGPNGVKLLAAAIIGGLPDRRITHDDVIAQGDGVMIRWSMSGTHAGELMGVAPTGRRVAVTGFDLFRIADGKITEMWQNWDQLGLMQQIGPVATAV